MSLVERDAAEGLITLAGRTLHTVCLFAGGGDLDVLGAYTLEGFGLGVEVTKPHADAMTCVRVCYDTTDAHRARAHSDRHDDRSTLFERGGSV